MHIKKNILLIISFLCASHLALAAESINAQIQADVDAARTTYHVPALQVSVSLPNEYTTRDFTSGTTILNGNEAVGTRHLYEIGSISKSFITTILLQLEAQNKLNINDRIDQYIDFSQHATWPSNWKSITIKQLLNMTSGIYNYTEAPAFVAEIRNDPGKKFAASDLIDIAAQQPNYFMPGKGYHYSNTDYVLAGMIAEKVSGKSVHDYLNANILGATHLNLLSTYSNIQYSDEIQSQMVHGYGLDNQGKLKDMTSSSDAWANTAGDMRSNTRDIVRWVRALFGNVLLPKQQITELKSLVCTDASSSCTPGQPVPLSVGGYGLGVSNFHDPVYGTVWAYTGITLGYLFNYIYVPADDIVISVAGDNTDTQDMYVKTLALKILALVDKKHQYIAVVNKQNAISPSFSKLLSNPI